ncbi:MAG: hypothetical protein CM1200mP35_00120 [Chloroflexota bacterium]|nr:MAG: hypothetical protein CM1200mP35_00120 [Chloroflexota bacterium]
MLQVQLFYQNRVLLEAQENLFAFPGIGMSVLEMSHRSKTVIDIMEEAESDIRTLASIPDNYSILFLKVAHHYNFL